MSSLNQHIPDELLDITDIIQHCASQCLSHSYPFTPPAKDDTVQINNNYNDVLVTADGMAGLTIQGTSCIDGGVVVKSNFNNDNLNCSCKGGPKRLLKLKQLDLLDAMSALELGDKRMDCCEIPYYDDESSSQQPQLSSKSYDVNDVNTRMRTFPPRISPDSLSDGTSGTVSLLQSAAANNTNTNSSPHSNNLPPNTLLLPTSPCPSLLPHWNTLQLTSTSLLPLLILQLTALEAYIGTNNGGSNAAETLYSMLWFHDGILIDMSERLSVMDKVKEIENISGSSSANSHHEHHHANGDNRGLNMNHINDTDDIIDELTVARWTLFASSLGIVRIAEAIRWVIVHADFYEEEDFGVAMHGKKVTKIDTLDGPKFVGSSATRFCPALQGTQICEVAWDTALLYLLRYRASYTANGGDMGVLNPTIDALENILRLQQSFFQAIKILSNLNDETVRDFANIATKRSQETVGLLDKLCNSAALTELYSHGLVGVDGQLQAIPDEPELIALLSASYSPFVNRRLLGNAPIRKACFRCPKEMLSSLSELVSELDWGVCSVLLHGNTLARIIRMMESNSLRGRYTPKKEETSPIGMNVLARSLLVLNLFFDDKLFGQHDFPQLIGKFVYGIFSCNLAG